MGRVARLATQPGQCRRVAGWPVTLTQPRSEDRGRWLAQVDHFRMAGASRGLPTRHKAVVAGNQPEAAERLWLVRSLFTE